MRTGGRYRSSLPPQPVALHGRRSHRRGGPRPRGRCQGTRGRADASAVRAHEEPALPGHARPPRRARPRPSLRVQPPRLRRMVEDRPLPRARGAVHRIRERRGLAAPGTGPAVRRLRGVAAVVARRRAARARARPLEDGARRHAGGARSPHRPSPAAGVEPARRMDAVDHPIRRRGPARRVGAQRGRDAVHGAGRGVRRPAQPLQRTGRRRGRHARRQPRPGRSRRRDRRLRRHRRAPRRSLGRDHVPRGAPEGPRPHARRHRASARCRSSSSFAHSSRSARSGGIRSTR